MAGNNSDPQVISQGERENWASTVQRREPRYYDIPPQPVIYHGHRVGRRSDARSAMAMLIGFITGALGMLGVNFWANNKLIPFKNDVLQKTKTDIMNINGGLANISGAGIDAAVGSHTIERAHHINLINSGNYPFAKFVHNLGGTGGISLLGGIAAFIVGSVAAYLISGISSKKKEEEKNRELEKIYAQSAQNIPVPMELQEQRQRPWGKRMERDQALASPAL